MYLRLLQKLIARDEREKAHVAALYRRDTRRTQWIGWLVGGTLALLLMQVISRPQELLIFLCGAAFLLAHPFRSLGRNEEEFAFTLPLPRRLYWQYDLATLVLPLAALSLFGTVVVSLELAAKFWGLFLDGPWVQERSQDDLPLLHLLPVIYIPMLLGACLSLISWCCRSTFMRVAIWIALIGLMTGGKMSQIHGLNSSLDTALFEWNLDGYAVRFPVAFGFLLLTFPLFWWLASWLVVEREVEASSGEESLSAPRIPLPQWSRLGLGSGRSFVGLLVIAASMVVLIQFHQDTYDLWQERFSARAKLDQGDIILREPSQERLKQRLPEEMTPLELLEYMSGFYARWDADLGRRGLERFGLDPKRPIGRFSGGEQRKLAVAAALAARPDLLLLDEPAAGLDPISRRDLLDALIELLGAVEGCTLILSTHLLADLERLADRIAVMKEGRLTLNDSLEEIQRRFRSVQLLFDREPGPDFVVPGLIQSQKNGLVWNCLLECPDERLLDQLRSQIGLQVIPNELSLEELFVRHLGKEM